MKEYAAKIASPGVSDNTVRLGVAPVRALLATAIEEGLIQSNPALGLRLFVRPRVEHGTAEEVDAEGASKALTEEELQGLLDKLPDRCVLFFEFLAIQGLRIGEAIELRHRDLDLGERFVHVRRRYYRGRRRAGECGSDRNAAPAGERLLREPQWIDRGSLCRDQRPRGTASTEARSLRQRSSGARASSRRRQSDRARLVAERDGSRRHVLAEQRDRALQLAGTDHRQSSEARHHRFRQRLIGDGWQFLALRWFRVRRHLGGHASRGWRSRPSETGESDLRPGPVASGDGGRRG